MELAWRYRGVDVEVQWGYIGNERQNLGAPIVQLGLGLGLGLE